MKHQTLKQIVCGADTAVLLIHGISGSPNHFSDFIPLIPEHTSVINLLLDGHGGTVQDFSRTSMKKWEAQVQAAVDELSHSHKRIIIAAHSMGTLFAIEHAIRNPKVTDLFLLSIPIIVQVRCGLLLDTWKTYLSKSSPDSKAAAAVQSRGGVDLSPNPFLYLGWIPRYLELFRKIRQTRAKLPSLHTPCTAYQSRDDELVSPRSVPYLKKHSRISVVELPGSRHFVYGDEDYALLLDAFISIF